MNPPKLITMASMLICGAIGLFAPVGAVKWVMRTDPQETGILTLFFLPVWCLLLVAGLLIGRRLGMMLTSSKRTVRRAG